MYKSKVTDQELWHAVEQDDSKAFAVLYNRYWHKLFKTAEYYLKHADSAETIVHDVFVVLWRRRKHLKIESFADYIHVTARYHIFKVLKAQKLSPIEYIESYETVEKEETLNTADEKLSYIDFEINLRESLKPLPQRCREIFWLSRIDHLSNDEIAAKFGISKRTVENQITHALKHLRTLIKDNPSHPLSLLWVIIVML